MSNHKLGDELRNLMWDEDCGFSIISYCDTGFLYGNESALMKAIIDEANRDPESCCRLKKEPLAYLAAQSDKTMFNSLNSLIELGLIISQKVKDGSLKYINTVGLVRLKEIFKHEYNGKTHRNKFVPRTLREEMKSRGIKSILDLTDDVIQAVYRKADEIKLEFDGATEQNGGSDGSRNGRIVQNLPPTKKSRKLDSVKSSTNQGGWLVQNLPPTGIIENNNNKTSSGLSIQRRDIKSIFQQGQDYTVQEEQKHLKKRKRTIKKA